MLQVEFVTAHLADHRQCVDLDFHVAENETYGILGDGSAGKTELIQLLSGTRPLDRGSVKVAGYEIHRNLRRAQHDLSVLSHNLALFPGMTVEDNLTFWGRLNNLSVPHLSERIDQVLTRVGYDESSWETVANLSVLNQKRIHLAAALLHDPKLLFLVQPTDEMNGSERDEFMQLIHQLQHSGLTMVYATDKVDEIQHVASRVAILDEGMVVAEGTVDELRDLLEGQSQLVIRCRPLQPVIDWIEEMALVHTVEAEKNEVRLWTTKPEEMLSQLFSDRLQKGIMIESVRVVEPTLAGVYLHLTGKSLEG